MAFLPPRRINGSSSSLTSSTSDVYQATNEDISARVVRRVLTATKWSPSSFANRLRVPQTCIEACLASGTSSQLLRSSLRTWINRGQDIPAALHHSEIVALKRDIDAREVPHAGSVFDELDDATRLHFEYLQSAIGQNFVSILNDPDVKTTSSTSSGWNSDWSSWLGQAVGVVATATMPAAVTGSTPNGDWNGLVSAAVAQATAAASSDFQQYFDDVGAVYRAHRELASSPPVRLLVPVDGSHAALLDAVEEEDAENERPAIPDSVSLEFASNTYHESSVLLSVLGRDGFGPNPAPQHPEYTPILHAASLLAHNLEQQQQAVTATLMSAVHSRTPRFFRASQQFNDLLKETRAALVAADATRADVQDGGAALIKCFLRVARHARRRDHCLQLLAEAEQLKSACAGLDFVDSAVADRRFCVAVRSIRTVEETLRKLEHTRFAALDAAAVRLADRRRALRGILRDFVMNAVVFSKWDDMEWEGLGDALHASHLIGCFDEMIAVYRTEAALAAVDVVTGCLIRLRILGAPHSWSAARNAALASALARNDVQANIHSDAVVNEAVNTCRSHVAQALHLMAPNAFHSTLVATLKSLEEHLMFCIRHKDVVGDCIASAATEAGEQTVDQLAWSRTFVTAISNALQDRAAWFFDARDDESIVSFSPPQLDRFVTETIQQVRNMEQIAADQFVALDGRFGAKDAPGLWSRIRAAIGSQIKVFFKRHHERAFERLLMVLGADKWDAQRVIEPCFNRFTETLASSSDPCIRATITSAVNVSGKPDEVVKPPEMSSAIRNDSPEPADAVHEFTWSTAFPGAAATPDTTAGEAMLSVPGFSEPFVATNSLLILLRTLAEYDWFFRRFPMLAPDAVQRIHDALKLFDGQCASLVLGGSAVDQGTLTAVTTPHFAIASQSLHFIATLAPKLQRRLARLAPGRAQAFVKNLERVAKEAAEHRNEAYQRLVDQFRSHIRASVVDPSHWAAQGKPWILGLLKECLKFWSKGLKPLLGHSATSQRVLVSALVNVLSGRIREVAVQIHAERDMQALRDDIRVFKANVENLLETGVLHCANMATTAAAVAATSLRPNQPEPDGAIIEHLGCGAALDV